MMTVWTASTQNDTVVHPITGPIPTSEAEQAWIRLEIRRNSGNCLVRAALQYSDDGETWDTAQAFGPAATSTMDYHDDTQFRDLTALGTRKRLVRFVLLAVNSTDDTVEYSSARLTLQLVGA